MGVSNEYDSVSVVVLIKNLCFRGFFPISALATFILPNQKQNI